MVSQSTRGENTVEALGHGNLCDRPPVCPAATTAWGRGQFTPLLPQWESPAPPTPQSLHLCTLPSNVKAVAWGTCPDPAYWRSQSSEFLDFSTSVWNSLLSPMGTFGMGYSPKCKQGFWKLASIRHTIFMPSSKQIFCSEVENLSVEVQEYSPSQVKAPSEVCVPPSC